MKDVRQTKGANFIGFSRSPSDRWVVVIDEWCPKAKRPDDTIRSVLFNKNYQTVLERSGVDCEVQSSNIAHIKVPFDQAELAVQACLPYIDKVEASLGTRKWEQTKEEIGFVNEALLEQFMIHNWDKLRFGTELDYIGNQIDHMDILARHSSGELVVFELKRAIAEPAVIEQLDGYVSGAAKKHTGGKPIWGAIVAERFRKDVLDAVDQVPYPLCLYRFRDTGKSFQLQRVRTSWPAHKKQSRLT